MTQLIIPEYKKEDYLQGTAPFEWLYNLKDNKLKQKQFMQLLSEKASAVGVKNFKMLYKMYLETINSDKPTYCNTTDFDGQALELDSGQWIADDYGITSSDKYGFDIIACTHPILPVRRLVDIDSGSEKLELAYKKSKRWRSIVVDKSVLASNTAILQLAGKGIAVTCDNAKNLIKYLSDIENLNYDKIPEIPTVKRLGWINENDFSPYVEDLVFDSAESYEDIYKSIKEYGSFDTWLDLVKEIRADKVLQPRIALAASFASVLLKPLGALPFFVHLWGTTESGKTVALCLAASVWGCPEVGAYVRTFSSTGVGLEFTAAFMNSMPFIIDELQIKKKQQDFDEMIYQLTEGVGKARGKKEGGLQKVQTWRNCFLSTGERPLVSSGSHSGAINRVIEMECNEELFGNGKTPKDVFNTVSKNYGFAGKLFVEALQDDWQPERFEEMQNEYIKELQLKGITSKQSLSGAIILTADKLITEYLFKDGNNLTVEQIAPYLSTKRDVSAESRAYEFLIETIAMNDNHFRSPGNLEFSDINNSIWGLRDDYHGYIYIIRSQFNKILSDEGYNPQAVLSWMARMGKIEVGADGKLTKVKKLCGNVVRCVWLKSEPEIEEVDEDSLPF